MAFGRPTRYLQLDLNRIPTTSSSNNLRNIWDKAVEQASDEYKKRMVLFISDFNFLLIDYLFSIIYVVITVIHMLLWH